MVVEAIANYEILERLGAGGMGVVYKARDERLGRQVALKILPPEGDTDDGRRRFMLEAKSASALNHPHIVTIYEVGQSEGLAYIAMEYVEGRTLRDWIAEGGHTLSEVLALAEQIAGAVAQAHAAGILHRDLKPSNLMVTPGGSIKVLDFGLAKRIATDASAPADTTLTVSAHTATGVISGTPGYMSPEQAEGQPLDARSDIFSFGAVLYEMLTGRAPFARKSGLGTLAAILHEDPPPPSRTNSAVSSGLDAVVARCLAKDPQNRFASMAEVHAALARASAAKNHTRSWKWVAMAAIATLLAVAAPAAHSRYQMWRAHRELPAQLHLAVLPFNNVGGDPANEAFCDGLSETLSSSLTRMEQFHSRLMVVPASEVRSIASAADARKRVGANLAITGSVQRTGSQIRLTVNLVDTRGSAVQIASWTKSAPAGSLNELIDETVERTAALLNLAMADRDKNAIAAGRTSDASAYELYMRARGLLQRHDKEGNIQLAIALLHKAVDQDPRYAAAYASLSEAYWRRFRESKELPDLQEARELGLRATQLDDRLASAHVILGNVHSATGDDAAAVREYRLALERDRVSADAHRALAQTLAHQGKLTEAEAAYRHAIALRPNDWTTLTNLGTFYSNQGRYREAQEPFKLVAELVPDSAIAFGNLASVHLSLGQLDLAATEAARAIEINPTPGAYLRLANVRFEQGQYRQAAELYEQANSRSRNPSYLILGNLADSYRWTPEFVSRAPGTYRRAIEAVDRAVTTNPRDGYALSCRALFCAKAGDLAAARRDIEKALALGPRDVRILANSVVVYELLKQRPRALKQLDAAVKAGFQRESLLRDPELQALREKR